MGKAKGCSLAQALGESRIVDEYLLLNCSLSSNSVCIQSWYNWGRKTSHLQSDKMIDDRDNEMKVSKSIYVNSYILT